MIVHSRKPGSGASLVGPLLLVIAAVVVPALSQTRFADAAPPGTGADPAIRQEITGVSLTDNSYLILEKP